MLMSDRREDEELRVLPPESLVPATGDPASMDVVQSRVEAGVLAGARS